MEGIKSENKSIHSINFIKETRTIDIKPLKRRSEKTNRGYVQGTGWKTHWHLHWSLFGIVILLKINYHHKSTLLERPSVSREQNDNNKIQTLCKMSLFHCVTSLNFLKLVARRDFILINSLYALLWQYQKCNKKRKNTF